MKCVFCGDEFEQKNKKGRKKNYCDKIECKKKANKLAQNKFYMKKKMELPMNDKHETTKTTKEEQPIIKEENQSLMQTTPNDFVRMYREDEIVYVKNLLPVANELAIEVLDFAKRLGALKYEGEQLKIKLSRENSKNDKEDDRFFHTIESAQKMTVGEIIKLFCDEGENREKRRDAKSFYNIVHCLINGIPCNPHEYAQKAIKGLTKANVTYAIRSEEAKLQNEKK